MKKIIVIGCPGSGKSTLSKELHRKTGIPLYHLDLMNWNADRTTVEKPVFLERLSSVLEKDGLANHAAICHGQSRKNTTRNLSSLLKIIVRRADRRS